MIGSLLQITTFRNIRTRFFAPVLVFLIMLIGCSGKDPKVRVAQGSNAYLFAEKLAQKLPTLEPKENRVLISSRYFDITSGELAQSIVRSIGTDLTQFDQLSESQLRSALINISQNLVQRKLLLRAALKTDITVMDAEVDSLVKRYITQFGGDDKFNQELDRTGQDMSSFKQELKEGVLRQRYLDRIVRKKAVVTEDDLRKAYEQVQKGDKCSFRHILLLTRGMSVSEKEKVLDKMKRISNQAKRGADFAALARRYSEDPGSKDSGGLYEDVARGDMMPEIEKVAFTLKNGEKSEIFESQYGYHLIKMENQQGNKLSFEEAREDLQKQLTEAKQQDVIDNEIARLRIEADVISYSF